MYLTVIRLFTVWTVTIIDISTGWLQFTTVVGKFDAFIVWVHLLVPANLHIQTLKRWEKGSALPSKYFGPCLGQEKGGGCLSCYCKYRCYMHDIFFLVNSFADNYIYFMYKCMSLRLFPIFSESDTCILVSSNSSILFLLRYRCI